MAEDPGRIKLLILKYLKDELLPGEFTELQDWIALSDDNLRLFTRLTNPDQLQEDIKEYHEAGINIKDKIDARLAALEQAEGAKLIELPGVGAYRSRKRRWMVAAASLLILFSAGTIWWTQRSAKSIISSSPAVAHTHKNDIPPGGNAATLTLGDGRTILLDSARNGALAQQGNSNLIKLANGQVVYNTTNERPAEVLYNTISTPRGGQYEVILPDGSKVWLNAASSLRFPTSFTGRQRAVEITGEAYLEVTKNKTMPFVVKTGGVSVAVLGTSLNIMAYRDEKTIKTTLINGSVRVSQNDQSVLLSPGQQAEVGNKVRVVSGIDMEEVLSWKDGIFKFNSADIETVMRSIARWYNVEIKYEGKISGNRLTALIKRDSYVSDVLQILETSGYHFAVEGKTITVLP